VLVDSLVRLCRFSTQYLLLAPLGREAFGVSP
jgi:hypothetical protein